MQATIYDLFGAFIFVVIIFFVIFFWLIIGLILTFAIMLARGFFDLAVFLWNNDRPIRNEIRRFGERDSQMFTTVDFFSKVTTLRIGIITAILASIEAANFIAAIESANFVANLITTIKTIFQEWR